MSMMLGNHVPELQLLDRLERTQYAIQILATPCPSLQELTQNYETKSAISFLTCADYIHRLDNLFSKQIKFTGQGREALLNAFSFILLAIGCKQNKYYPHLISIIKEQFFKPGVFVQYDTTKRNKILNIVRNIQIQLINYRSVCEFLSKNDEFLQAFHHILNKILQSTELTKNYHQRVQIFRKRFNIDCTKIQISNSHAQCWVLGMQRKIYLFQEKQCFIVVSASTSTQPNKSMNQSAIQNRVESQRSISQTGQQVILQASQQSTPKFKQNQQSIRYRKKSHKNSFGGDFEITGYRQLANLVNKGQQDSTPEAKQNKFEMQEMGCLTMEEQSPNHAKQLEVDNTHEENNLNIAKNQIQMRGSHIEGGSQARRIRGEKGERKKHITSSEIFNLMNRNQKKGMESEPEILLKTEELRNDVINTDTIKEQIQHEQEKGIIDHQANDIEKDGQFNSKQGIQRKNNITNTNPNQKNMVLGILSPPTAGTQKEHFKLSFSKKDASRFVFKQIQSEYSENDLDHDLEVDPTEIKIGRFLRNGGIKTNQLPLNNNSTHLLRSSLTNPKSNNTIGLLSDYEYLKRREKNRQSLLLDTPIAPIQEEVQSSQRDQTQQQSISQSQKQIDNSQQQQDLQQKSNTSNNNKVFGYNGANNELNNINSYNKNYINIFKSKNRKFSFLTQPMSTSKNSLFNGNNEELRQSYMEEGNQTIPESQQNALHNPTFFQNNCTSKNRMPKPPKKIHKNSQAITESKPQKRKFQQNPISFSQMINIKDDSNFSAQLETATKRPPQLSINLNVLQFVKDNIMCYNEPQGWVRKVVVYYFGDSAGWTQECINRRKPERYIIDRTPPLSSNQPFSPSQTNGNPHQLDNQPSIPPLSSYSNSHLNMTEPTNLISNRMNKSNSKSFATQIENKSNSLSNLPHQNTNVISYSSGSNTVKNINNKLIVLQDQDTKIRSSIDTTILPPATYLNIDKNNVNNNVSTPPSSIYNLPSQFNPEEKRQIDNQKSKTTSVRNGGYVENDKQKQKIKHKHYKDLQSLHLNLRKDKNDKGIVKRKKDIIDSEKNNGKQHPTLQIIYPSPNSAKVLNNSFPISPSITAATSTELLNKNKTVYIPSLSFLNKLKQTKEKTQNFSKQNSHQQPNQKKSIQTEQMITSLHLFIPQNNQGNNYSDKSRNKTTNPSTSSHYAKSTSPHDKHINNQSNQTNKNTVKNQVTVYSNQHYDLTKIPKINCIPGSHIYLPSRMSVKTVKVLPSVDYYNERKTTRVSIPRSPIMASITKKNS